MGYMLSSLLTIPVKALALSLNFYEARGVLATVCNNLRGNFSIKYFCR
jgi:hypothetical protein